MAAASSLTQQAANELASYWSKIDWHNLQINLNEEVNAIGIRQDESEESRKYLLDESKKFRESADKIVRKAVLPLIKAFQSEVDRLTVRSKAAEAQLINVGRTLLHVPDPSHYLEKLGPLIAKVKRLESAEEQLQLLKRRLKELEEEYGDLQNQELTIRQLREQLKNSETQVIKDVQITVSEKEKVLRTEFQVFKNEMNESHEKLLVQNEKLSRDVADLEVKNREVNRLMDQAKMKLAMKESTESEQLEIISNDLENALRRTEDAEKEVERWRNEALNVERSILDAVHEKEFASASSKDLQIQKLMEENHKLSSKLTKEMEESNKRIEQLTKELKLHIEMVDRLQTQIRSQSDYEDIKKELRILRTVEFGDDYWLNGENVDNGVTSSATATAEVQLGGRLKALDELLVEKNRKLQGENVELRMRNQELEELLGHTEHENNSDREQLIKQRELIAQLEVDLSSLNTLVVANANIDTAHRGSKDVADSEQSTLEMLAEELNSDLAPEPNNNGASLLVSASQKTAAEQSGNVTQVLAIVFAQRDRLRERVNQLSSEMSSLAECNSLLHAQVQSARDDNVHLYTKIKFLQSYQTGSTRSQGETMVRMEHSGAENRYADEYERHLDPFRKFNIQERQRKYGQLRAHDKAVLSLGRWLMGSGQSRTLFFIYLLLLHVLVFIVLYRFAYTESCRRDLG